MRGRAAIGKNPAVRESGCKGKEREKQVAVCGEVPEGEKPAWTPGLLNKMSPGMHFLSGWGGC